jgi:hypothetical protein
LDGLLSLVCPAEEKPDFVRLLAMLDDGAREAVVNRAALSSTYLSGCRDVLRAVEERARGETGATFVDPILQGLQQVLRFGPALPPGISPPPALLRPDYWERIYQLAVLSRLRGEELRPDEERYNVRKSRTDQLSNELYLGDTLLGTGPLDVPRGWLTQHRQAIGDWAGSQQVFQLVETYNSLKEAILKTLESLEKLILGAFGEKDRG